MSDRTFPTAESSVVRLAQAASDSLTDSMVERLTITGANAMEVVDLLNDEDTRDAVVSLVEKLTDLHRTGALDTLFQLITLVHGAREAVTDNMVERLFMFVEHMMTNLANEEVASVAHNAKEAMAMAAEETAKAPANGGLMSAIAMLSKPETQQALNFLVTASTKMRELSEGGES